MLLVSVRTSFLSESTFPVGKQREEDNLCIVKQEESCAVLVKNVDDTCTQCYVA